MELNLLFIIVGIFIGVLVFFLLREVFCWYFKINQTISILDDMNQKLSTISRSIVYLNNINSNIEVNNKEDNDSNFDKSI